MLHIQNIEEFKEAIMKKSVIMIHKTNCPFCEKAEPWMEELAKKYPDSVIGIVNKDNIAKVLDVFQVKMYPTFVAFNEGKVIDMFYGDTKEEKVKSFVEANC